jgi:hypothetical protein
VDKYIAKEPKLQSWSKNTYKRRKKGGAGGGGVGGGRGRRRVEAESRMGVNCFLMSYLMVRSFKI